MNDAWIKRWNDRYSKKEFAYGVLPNHYLKEQLEKLKPGTILFPAEGEGRNGVFAASLGWSVFAFDISNAGKIKAQRLAAYRGVKMNYSVGDLQQMNYQTGQFDVIALIYAHFPSEIKSTYHKILDGYLKQGGIIIFEAFSKSHLDYVNKNDKVGGPKDLGSLFSVDEIRSDFANYEIIKLGEEEIELNEGLYHNGAASVIRFVGKKK